MIKNGMFEKGEIYNAVANDRVLFRDIKLRPLGLTVEGLVLETLEENYRNRSFIVVNATLKKDSYDPVVRIEEYKKQIATKIDELTNYLEQLKKFEKGV